MINRSNLFSKLLKLHAPGGRYTYYPRRGAWQNNATREDIKMRVESLRDVEVYLHMPFCKELCTFCGCNIKITANPNDFSSYTNAIIKEWHNYKKINPKLKIKRLYIGGGSPNYLPIENYQKIFENLEILNDCSIEIEIDPRHVSDQFLTFFNQYNVERLIVGIQEIDEHLLLQVNRKSDPREVLENLNKLKKLEAKDITGEFIYGLPFQTPQTIERALEFYTSNALSSVQLYPLAPVPWNEGVQKSFGRYEPLAAKELNEVLSHAVDFLESHDFINFHFGLFSKKGAHYSKQKENGRLTRTMMGTLPHKALPVLGLGPSSISSFDDILLQNDPLFERYDFRLQSEDLAIIASHKRSAKEESFEKVLHKLICHDELSSQFDNTLRPFIQEGFIDDANGLHVTSLGKNFTKYLCHALEVEYFR